MTQRTEQMVDEAIGWTIRLRSADAAEWQAFSDWLEANPAHRQAYDDIALLDAGLDDLRSAPPILAEPEESRQPAVRRRWFLGGLTAAAAAAAALIVMPAGSDPYQLQTGPGETRSVTLAGGSTIHLNGSTEVVLDRQNPRFARLVTGEALFSVASDPTNPFRVEAGPAVIRNLGTVFNVRHDAPVVDVAVAEGAISFNAGRHELGLAAGEAVRMTDEELETSRREPSTIGGWRSGELSYSSATLAQVAQDLSRTTGLTIRAEPGVAARRFSGTIIIGQDREQMRRRLGALLDVDVRVADREWILAAPR